MNLYLRGGGSQISTTLDSVTERGGLREFFWVQTVFFMDFSIQKHYELVMKIKPVYIFI